MRSGFLCYFQSESIFAAHTAEAHQNGESRARLLEPGIAALDPVTLAPSRLASTDGVLRTRGGDEAERNEIESPKSSGANVQVAAEAEADGDEGRYGMFILEDKPEDETGLVDIVAIHGLTGHYRNTWRAKSDSGKEHNWLKDFLPQEIPNARIMSFGYNSAVQFSKSVADIETFADGLVEDLMSWRRSSVEKERPLIFICHSFGGIVFKSALIRARERDRYETLLKKIRGVAFFGVPHKGSSTADWTLGRHCSPARTGWSSPQFARFLAIQDKKCAFTGSCRFRWVGST
ncbi:MAG: hypothetical protein M1839_008964 [Geoglossum umbratile]|nr:MAG: hypothetical protein M1839_008964 [Geoglossum umbratile]